MCGVEDVDYNGAKLPDRPAKIFKRLRRRKPIRGNERIKKWLDGIDSEEVLLRLQME